MLAASGWLADRFGYKTVFLAALVLFTTGSFLCSVSWSLGALIASRAVQGVGGGLLMPVSMAMVTREFPKEKLGIAVAVWSMPALASTSFGPTLGGWLIDNFSWQTMFDVNVPIGILAFAACSRVLREHRAAERPPFDFAGFASLTIALSALLLALADGNAAWNTDGWTSTFIVSCFSVSAAAFALFFVCQLTSAYPVIDFSLFRIYNFGMSTMVIFIFGLGIFGSDFLLPLYLQNGLGYTPTQAGMVFIPFGFVMMATGAIGGRLTDRIGAKIPGVTGILLRALGMYRFTFLTTYSSNAEILGTVCLLAAGMGFLMAPLQATAIQAIPESKTAQASGLIQIIRQIGGSFGVAVLSTLLVDREKFHLAIVGQTMNAQSPAAKEVLSRAFFHALRATGGTTADAVSKGQALVLSHLQTQVFVWSIDDVFFAAMLISVISSIPFLFLKNSGAPGPLGEGDAGGASAAESPSVGVVRGSGLPGAVAPERGGAGLLSRRGASYIERKSVQG